MKKKLAYLILLALLIIIPVKANAESLLSRLAVEGIGDLNLQSRTWNLGFSTSLGYANIIATGVNDSVKIEGAGKVDVKEGKNTFVITATSGETTETYTINMNVSLNKGAKSAAPSGEGPTENGEDVKNPETGGFITTTLFGLSGGAIVLTLISSKSKKKLFSV